MLVVLIRVKAYIYNTVTRALLHTLDNPNAYGTSASDQFGRSVSITDTYAIVGAYNEEDAGGALIQVKHISTTLSLVHYYIH